MRLLKALSILGLAACIMNRGEGGGGWPWVMVWGVHGWVEVSKPCPLGCNTNGNCNAELGVCECAPGLKGAACEIDSLSACRTALGNPLDHPALTGVKAPKNCECYRQARWVSHGMSHPLVAAEKASAARYCFEYVGVPADKQTSDPPLVTDTVNVTWKRPLGSNGADANFEDYLNPDGSKVPIQIDIVGVPRDLRDDQPEPTKVLPLSQCPDRCHDRGICIEGGKCFCQKAFQGLNCEGVSTLCLANCSGVGRCLGGFCHCPPGRWGMDCGRSKAYAPNSSEVREASDTAYERTALKIYRYELPWQVLQYREGDDCQPSFNRLYGAFMQFYDRLSSDLVVRTENPGEANLFQIPLLSYIYHTDARAANMAKKILLYVTETYPQHWARNQGRDHFMFLTADLGACWFYDEAILQNPIKVVHFALQIKAVDYKLAPNYWWAPDHPMNREYNCFKNEKDVTVSCNDADKDLGPNGAVKIMSDKAWVDALLGRPRLHLLYFGGGIREQQPEYSGGARQAFYRHVMKGKNEPENATLVQFGGSSADYKDAVFCMNPYGDGWGNRMPYMVLGACIPVTIQDYVHQPFDDIIDYNEIGIRIRTKDVPQLIDILQSVTPDQIQAYRRALHKVYKAYYWVDDGEAYKFTLMSLHRRLHHLWGSHYK